MTATEGKDQMSEPSETRRENSPLLVPADDLSVLSDTQAGLKAITLAMVCFFLVFAARYYNLRLPTLALSTLFAWSLWNLAGLRVDAVRVQRIVLQVSATSIALASIQLAFINRTIYLLTSAAFLVLLLTVVWLAYRDKGWALMLLTLMMGLLPVNAPPP